MPDLKMSQLPLRDTLALTDEFLNLADGGNYRSPMSALTPILGNGGSPGSDSGEFNRVADMLASTAPAQGVGTVWRADGFRYREADPVATDHQLTTAGGVKLYVQKGDDGWYNLLAMNPARDGVTNDAPKLQKLIDIRGYRDPVYHPNWNPGPSIFIPSGTYFMDAGPWGFQLKATTHLRGEAHTLDNDFRKTVLKFPQDVVGIMVNHLDTFENQVEDVATGGAISSTIERISLISNAALGSNPNAHGIWAKTTVHIRDVTVYGFFGHGIAVTGSGSKGAFWVSGTNYSVGSGVRNSANVMYYCVVDPGGAITSVNEPTHLYGDQAYGDGYTWGIYDHGGPSGCSFMNVHSFSNHNCGIYITGHDASVMAGFRIDVNANGRWGIYDDSFLGNTWVMVHSEGNGLATRGGNAAGHSSCVSVYISGVAPALVYDFYFAAANATEEQLVTVPPGTDDSVWVLFRDNLVVTFVPNQHPPWVAGQPVGTYFKGGCYWSGGPSPRNVWLGCYAELSEGFGVLGDTSLSLGGVARWQGGAAYDAVAGIMSTRSGYDVADTLGNTVRIGGDTAATETQFVPYSYRSVAEPLPYRFIYGAVSGGAFYPNDWTLEYGASTHVYNITGTNTTHKMGTSKAQPYLMHLTTLALGGPTTTRRQTASSAKPTTGEWAAGDLVWNTAATPTKTAGWLVTKAGAFGSTTWTTGTNYALNAYVLASSGKYYRCSVDPGSTLLSTVEPTHSSGEVISPTDNYGWTFVSLTSPEILPFGEAIDFYDHTTTAALSLGAGTHPRQIIVSATIDTTFTVGLNGTAAYPGLRFHITRTGGGAGVCNIGTGPLKVLATNTWCEVSWTGSAFILTAYGTL